MISRLLYEMNCNEYLWQSDLCSSQKLSRAVSIHAAGNSGKVAFIHHFAAGRRFAHNPTHAIARLESMACSMVGRGCSSLFILCVYAKVGYVGDEDDGGCLGYDSGYVCLIYRGVLRGSTSAVDITKRDTPSTIEV